MARVAVITAAVLALVPTVLCENAYRAPTGPPIDFPSRWENTCAAKALDYLAGCHAPSSPECVQRVAVQAVAFCSSHLSVTASDFNTITKVPTVQVQVTTKTETVTEVITSTSTSTAPTSFVTPEVTATVIPRGDTSCPDLSKKALTRRPAAKLSSVCSCLGVTAPATTETTKFRSTYQVSVSTTTTTTTTTTSTTTGVVTTTTPIVDYCDITYNGGGVTPGNTVIVPPGDLNGRECCVLCWSTPNCVASATGLGFCQLLVKTSPLEGAPTSLQCPLGIEDYVYLEGPGTLYRGPCSPGLN